MMDETHSLSTSSPPLVAKPMKEVLALIGIFPKCIISKDEAVDSPLVPLPMTDILKMMNNAMKTNNKNISGLSSKKNNNTNKISFKIPKRLSSVNKTRQGTNKSNDIRPKPLSQVRKALFFEEEAFIVPPKAKTAKNKVSFAAGNINKPLSTMGTNKQQISTKTTIKSPFHAIKSSDEELKQKNVLKLDDLEYLQTLLKKQQDLTIEINETCQRLYKNIACFNKNGKNSPFTKKINVNLLKTVQEKNMERAKDVQMTDSIAMYNTMRMDCLKTPKQTRHSLENGDNSISTTIQKQCLLLMDTPQV